MNNSSDNGRKPPENPDHDHNGHGRPPENPGRDHNSHGRPDSPPQPPVRTVG